MPDSAFAYATLRVVPNIERGEFVNAGVVLFARQHKFLAVRIALDEAKFAAIGGGDPATAREALRAIERVAAGDPDAGPIAALDQSERFGWITAPSSTIVQPSPTHTGICDDPQRALDELFDDLVA